ncbi:MAG TPA: ABC transporter substrate-binding protein [Allosphingosinicella sp.]|nr:ABC transporter substrate-binding protein [Allosphingosinicella sp.]
MRAAVLLILLLALSACGSGGPAPAGGEVAAGRPIPMAKAQTFSVVERDGYRIVEIEASVVSWGGTAGGPSQRARLVLVPRAATPPALTGDLAGATLIRTPVQRIAVNDQPHEAIVRALGLTDHLVAVGGHSSYDDGIRARVRAGQIQQVGYGWHQAPTLDALVASRPDVFLARMADLTHTQHMDRIRRLGIPVVPTFIDAEPHYMGRLDWVRLVGMLTGKEREAEAFVAEVTREVDRLKRLAAAQPRRSLLWAWYQSSGDRWSVTQRNGEAALIRDANAELVLGQPDNPELDVFSRLSTEQLLRDATNADCWMIRDPLSNPYTNREVLQRFKAYREGCVFWQPGRRNPAADAWELWEMGTIRPDWQLWDIIKMVHPQLRDGQWRYLALETGEAASGAGHN